MTSGEERKTMEVVAAAIIQDRKVFATQRGYGDYKGWWEFPGGKIEHGETKEQALKRELREELAIETEVGDLIKTVEYDYPKFHLILHCFLTKIIKGEPKLLEHESARWVDKNNVDDLNWLKADLDVIKEIKEKFLSDAHKMQEL